MFFGLINKCECGKSKHNVSIEFIHKLIDAGVLFR